MTGRDCEGGGVLPGVHMSDSTEDLPESAADWAERVGEAMRPAVRWGLSQSDQPAAWQCGDAGMTPEETFYAAAPSDDANDPDGAF